MIELDTRKVVVLSTLHLSVATRTLLSTKRLADWPVAGAPLPWGFYIYAHEEPGDDVPDDLRRVLGFARERGFDYVQFDFDGEPIDALPAFEEE
jgi:hypothetical protein